MMNKTTKKYLVWGGVGLGVIALFFVINGNRSKQPKPIAESAKVEPALKIESSKDNLQDYNTRLNADNPTTPYVTNGKESEDSNYFIPTTVPKLEQLVEPEKNATIVWVSARSCHICHQMRPFVAESANKFADKIALKEIDLLRNTAIAREFRITGTPTFFVLDSGGQIVHRFNGANQTSFESVLAQASELKKPL